jgi:porin
MKTPTLLLLTLCATTSLTRAGFREGDHLLGDRPALTERGIEPFAYYTANIAGNAAGGFDQGGLTYVHDLYFGLKLDLEKLVGWTGGNFVISGVERTGDSLTEDYVGSVYNSQQVYGGQNVFLYQFYLDQKFMDDRLSLKIGRFGASDDFNASPMYGMYMNNGINGDIRNVLFDTQFSAYPFATWAARVKYEPSDDWDIQVGAFQTWEDIFDRSHNGLDWGFHGGDSVFLIAQVGWSPVFGTRWQEGNYGLPGDSKKMLVEPEVVGLPGHYWIGGSYTPWEGFTEFGDGGGRKVGDSYGFYVHADQMVYRENYVQGDDQGLVLWAASGLYPQEEISIVPFQVNAGAIYQGLIPGRDKDKTMLGVIYGKFSDDYAAQQRRAGKGDPREEIVIEAGHRIQLTNYAYIQPDVQYIIQPGGTGDIDNALVLGVQIGVTF